MSAESETNGGISQWIGRSEEREDVVTAAPLAGLAATLDYASPPWRDDEVPPLAHWLYFLPRSPQHELAEDGHPTRGGFLPPVPLPRRMWAGGSITFEAPIAVGETIRRRSTIAEIQHKTGRSGDLVFVKVVHEVFGSSGVAVREEQDIVYREAAREAMPAADERAQPRAAKVDVPTAEWTRTIQPDSVLLFRFSALTFNGHRIHYDREYCREHEGYPGLVVHGPLMATLLMDLFLRNNPETRVRAFKFRGQQPAFDTDPLTLCGVARDFGASLWAVNTDGDVVMNAEVETR
ncbi:MAG: MaoC family dehydratase N-terminal domain-containing protein [Gemmatimonas sp.]